MSGSQRVGSFCFFHHLVLTYSHFLRLFAVPKFEELLPALPDSEERVQDFMFLPEVDRTFRFEQVDARGSSSDPDMSTGKFVAHISTFCNYLSFMSVHDLLGSRATHSSSKYNLSDINDVIFGATAVVKRVKTPLQIPKAPVPLPVESSGSGIKKRKTLEILDLTVDDLESAEVMKKLATMVEMATDQISRRKQDKQMRRRSSWNKVRRRLRITTNKMPFSDTQKVPLKTPKSATEDTCGVEHVGLLVLRLEICFVVEGIGFHSHLANVSGKCEEWHEEEGDDAVDHEQKLRLMNREMTKKVEELEKERDRLAEENLNLKTEKIDTLKQHLSEAEEVMADSRTSAAIAVLQARIEMAGENPSNWDVAGWKDALIRLMGSEAEGSIEEKVPEKVEKSKSIVATF
ncbi:hypothetical protein LXL04_016582 [Taraxacum kok-saghyz]